MQFFFWVPSWILVVCKDSTSGTEWVPTQGFSEEGLLSKLLPCSSWEWQILSKKLAAGELRPHLTWMNFIAPFFSVRHFYIPSAQDPKWESTLVERILVAMEVDEMNFSRSWHQKAGSKRLLHGIPVEKQMGRRPSGGRLLVSLKTHVSSGGRAFYTIKLNIDFFFLIHRLKTALLVDPASSLKNKFSW